MNLSLPIAPSPDVSCCSDDSALIRTDWKPIFPLCWFHTPWSSSRAGGRCLSRHPDFVAAKQERNLQAAERIISDLHTDKIFDLIENHVCYDDRPLVVAPIKTPEINTNALSLAYAYAVASTFGLYVDRSIISKVTYRRDRKANNIDRLVAPTLFEGEVQSNKNYIIVDDVLTTGGTIATLKGYIEQNGGRVICTTTLAAGHGVAPLAHSGEIRQFGVKIALSEATFDGLKEKLGKQFDELDDAFRKGFHYGLQHLTEPEAQYILGQISYCKRRGEDFMDSFGKRLVQARTRAVA